MDFSFSDEQRQLKDSVDRFVRQQYPFEDWRKVVTADPGFKPENWQQMAELGWLGVAIPEDWGGLGGSSIDTMVIMEGLGRGLVPEPYVSTVVLGAGLISEAGTEAQKQELLPAIAEGRLKLALAQAEPQSRFSLADAALTAKRQNGGFVLDGVKSVVFDAPTADRFLVTARTAGSPRDERGVSLFLVPADAPGLEQRAYRTVDHRRAADLGFSGVKVPAEALVGEADQGLGPLEKVVDQGIAAVAAEAVGGMQVLCDATNEYLKTRKQFGVTIGSFQVLQHRMVEMWIALEQARSMAYVASIKLSGPDGEAARAAAAAKVQIGQSGRFVGQQAIQLHGGMGMSDELNVSHYMKRLMMLDLQFGNADHHRKRFAAMG